jgi:uncharacterized protein (DUF362 family)
MRVPFGGYMYPGFDLNHSYEDCDVFVSLSKVKEHATAGITLGMKNLFGLTPATIYGSGAGVDEPSIAPNGGRNLVHVGNRGPSKSAPQELNPGQSRDDGYRVPRAVVDLNAARPVHLTINEAVRTMTGGEGPWVREDLGMASPGWIAVGTNVVTTDAVSMHLMNFDPMADRGAAPFERCDNTLKLAEDAGLGTRDLKRIEVAGGRIEDLRFDFLAIREKRRGAPRGSRGIRG